MRLRLFVLALVATVPSACSSRYYVRGDHLQRAQQIQAQTGQEVALPALDRDRDQTFLRYEAIRKIGMVELATGLQEVSARDVRKSLKINGWILSALALVYGVTAIAVANDGDEDMAVLFGATGATIAAPGITLLILGYSLQGPEADGPSPGMPATILGP